MTAILGFGSLVYSILLLVRGESLWEGPVLYIGLAGKLLFVGAFVSLVSRSARAAFFKPAA
jgi:hypothetical protein